LPLPPGFVGRRRPAGEAVSGHQDLSSQPRHRAISAQQRAAGSACTSGRDQFRQADTIAFSLPALRAGWVHAVTGEPIGVEPTHWREWHIRLVIRDD